MLRISKQQELKFFNDHLGLVCITVAKQRPVEYSAAVEANRLFMNGDIQ
jgi:hypothetical protein